MIWPTWLINPFVYLTKSVIAQTSSTSFSHHTLKNAPLKWSFPWALLTTRWPMSHRKHHLMEHFTGWSFTTTKVTGTASGRAFRIILSHLSSEREFPELTHLISKWILSGINNFIPKKKYQQKPNSQTWFITDCPKAIQECFRKHKEQSVQDKVENKT